MKINCGTDIIEIERIKKAIENVGDKFISRVFTESEIEYCESKKSQKYQHYAARFAAKEATYKAIAEKIGKSWTWKSFEVVKNENGKPCMKVDCNVEELESLDISISHCKEYAVATVVAQFCK